MSFEKGLVNSTYKEQVGLSVFVINYCLVNFYAEYIMKNAGLDEAQLKSGLLGEISITSAMQMTPPLWQKVKRN